MPKIQRFSALGNDLWPPCRLRRSCARKVHPGLRAAPPLHRCTAAPLQRPSSICAPTEAQAGGGRAAAAAPSQQPAALTASVKTATAPSSLQPRPSQWEHGCVNFGLHRLKIADTKKNRSWICMNEPHQTRLMRAHNPSFTFAQRALLCNR